MRHHVVTERNLMALQSLEFDYGKIVTSNAPIQINVSAGS